MNSSNYVYSLETAGVLIDSDMFGTNILIHRDDVGGAGRYAGTVDAVGATVIRYPGGTVAEDFFDLANPNRTVGTGILTGITERSLLPISEFLNYAESTNRQVLIVLPTYRYFDPETGGIVASAEAEVRQFIKSLLQGEYGSAAIAGLEVGNEWYQDRFQWTAAEFGAIQSELARWISEEAAILGVEVPIFIQAGRGDDDGNGIDDNFELASTLDQATAREVDGLISHIYVATSGSDPLVLGGAVEARLEAVDRVWGNYFDRDFDQVITEWNVGESGPASTTINGLMRIAPLLRLFTIMVEAGVDIATIWTAQNSSPAALSGPESGSSGLTPTGLFFRMLSTYLPGTSLHAGSDHSIVSEDNGRALGYSYSFSGEGRTVLLFSSGTDEAFEVNADLTSLISSSSHVFGILLGAAPGSTGTEFRTMAQLEILSGEELGIVDAADGVLDFVLEPFETVMLVVSKDVPVEILLDPQASVPDLIVGSSGDDTLNGYRGDDTLLGMDGHDVIHVGGLDIAFGGMGDDHFLVEDGFSRLNGGEGLDYVDFSDFRLGGISVDPFSSVSSGELVFGALESVEGIRGSNGDDQIYASDLLQFVFGNGGDDFLFVFGGEQKTVDGGDGRDAIYSHAAGSLIFGGQGDDFVFSSGDFGLIDGGEGDDVVIADDWSSILRDTDGDDTYDITLSDGTLLDFSRASGSNRIYGFDDLSHSLWFSQEQISEISFEVDLDELGLSVMMIRGCEFSVALHGLSHVPSISVLPEVYGLFE